MRGLSSFRLRPVIQDTDPQAAQLSRGYGDGLSVSPFARQFHAQHPIRRQVADALLVTLIFSS
jgi:hypothetical protein